MIFEIMSPYDVPEYFGSSNSVIIDIREIDEYEKSHIPTAKHYKDFCEEYTLEGATSKLDNYMNIIIYCNHGTSSIKVALDLCLRLNKVKEKRDGFVYSLYGGIENYSGIRI